MKVGAINSIVRTHIHGNNAIGSTSGLLKVSQVIICDES